MKARYLKKLLNDTGYIVADHGDYIGVGSPMCHKLISVDKKTLKITYALDWQHLGRKALEDRDNKTLLFIWDKLTELINSGEIKTIIEENDIFENPLTVWVWDGNLGMAIEKQTDAYGWPNVTHDGTPLYNGGSYPTRREALEYGLKNIKCGIENLSESLHSLSEDLLKRQKRLCSMVESMNKVECELNKKQEAGK